MDLNRLCPGCMSELTDVQNQSVCPYCGYRFDAEQEEPAHRLKPHTVLNGKYVILSDGSMGQITYIDKQNVRSPIISGANGVIQTSPDTVQVVAVCGAVI